MKLSSHSQLKRKQITNQFASQRGCFQHISLSALSTSNIPKLNTNLTNRHTAASRRHKMAPVPSFPTTNPITPEARSTPAFRSRSASRGAARGCFSEKFLVHHGLREEGGLEAGLRPEEGRRRQGLLHLHQRTLPAHQGQGAQVDHRGGRLRAAQFRYGEGWSGSGRR